MYRALYRKYRPASFSDVVGQEHIVTTLMGQLQSGKISHAYLFTGSRGTGKTSCAKILAKAVNCLNLQNGDVCLKCDSCSRIENDENFDIVEIDAASNNGVDNIRNLKEQVTYAPAQSKYRVYIIDEVHMLSTGAFNALLKTLEEPPATVIFILATTEVHKLPATILSRCQRFDFRRIEPDKIAERLLKIAELEQFELDKDAAMLIASMVDGGMRDALSMLDLCAAKGGRITEKTVETATAMAGKDALLRLVEAILCGSAPSALKLIDTLYKCAVDIQHLCEQLLGIYRNLMIIKSVPDSASLVSGPKEQLARLKLTADKHSIEQIMMGIRQLSDALNRMNAANRRSELEMAVIKLCSPALSGETENILHRLTALEKGMPAGVEKMPVSDYIPEPEKEPEPTHNDEQPTATEEKETQKPQDGRVENWAEVVKELGTKSPLLSAYLNVSAAYIQGEFLLIDCENTQFSDLIRQPTHRDSLRRAAEAVLGRQYKLGPYKKNADSNTEQDPLDEIMQRLESFEE